MVERWSDGEGGRNFGGGGGKEGGCVGGLGTGGDGGGGSKESWWIKGLRGGGMGKVDKVLVDQEKGRWKRWSGGGSRGKEEGRKRREARRHREERREERGEVGLEKGDSIRYGKGKDTRRRREEVAEGKVEGELGEEGKVEVEQEGGRQNEVE